MSVSSSNVHTHKLGTCCDQEGKWKIEPGLAAIVIIEHVPLLLKFGLSRLVSEEPAWVKVSSVKNMTQAQDIYCKQLLRSIYDESSSMPKSEQEQGEDSVAILT